MDTTEDGLQGLKQWNTHLEAIRRSPYLSPEEVRRTLSGWRRLAQVMGAEWLASAVDKRHPLLETMINRAPWAMSFIATLGGRLYELRKRPGFQPVLQRLRNSEEYTGAMAEVEVGYALHQARLPVLFLEPQIRPRADILTEVDGVSVEIEVVVLRQSQYNRMMFSKFCGISEKLMRAGLEYAGRISKDLSRPHIEALERQIDRAVEAAQRTRQLQEIVDPDTVVLCIAPAEVHEQIDGWKRQHGIEGSGSTLIGPSLEHDAPRRIRAALLEKAHQISSSARGVLVVWCGDIVYSYGPELDRYVQLANDIEEAVFETPQLLFAVLKTSYFGPSAQPIVRGDGSRWYAAEARTGVLVDNTVIVENRYARFERIDRLIQAFLPQQQS